MGEVVNLNKARKARAQGERLAQAAENRVRFGRSKAERARIDAEADARARHVEGHRRDPAPPPEPDEPA